MSHPLKISKELSLPLNAVTQTFGILARKRVGKTYTASVMAEEMIKAKVPIVVLDPTGAWWGLRASATGKSDGLPVVIIGGAHGDVPLEPTAGKVIADLVIQHPGYYVIDLSGTESNSQQDRFAMDFAERLYRGKESKKFPMHLFIDEADSFAPQRPMDGQQRMLGAFEAIVRRGGIRGIGVTMITQRPAVLNKNILTQCECLIVLQMTGPQDQDAIKEWVSRNGTKSQQETLMGSLASLQRGEAWVWSPSWLDVFKKVQIRTRETFNSSATPDAGEAAVVTPKMAKVDLESLGEQIKATVENAKANDPGELKRQIAALKKEKAEIEKHYANFKPETTKVEVPIFNAEALEKVERAVEFFMELKQAADRSWDEACKIQLDLESLKKIAGVMTQRPSGAPVPSMPIQRRVIPVKRPEIKQRGDGSLGRCDRAILTALAQYPYGRSSNQVAVLTGYSGNSGGFNNSLSKLRSSEFITRGNPMQITEAGLSALGHWEPLPTGDGLQQHWLNRSGKCEAAILGVLLKAYPEGMTSEEVAAHTGYAPSSGGFNNSLSKLRTLELITRGQPMKASEDFFQ